MHGETLKFITALFVYASCAIQNILAKKSKIYKNAIRYIS